MGPLDRATWMSVLAQASAGRLHALLDAIGELPAHTVLRAPQPGTVMVQGRMGGTGAPFNVGEVTVTRASVQLCDGTIGHAYVRGRDRRHARDAALADALLQTVSFAATVRHAVIEPLRDELRAARALAARKAAATRVEFFTMTRGDNPA